MKKNQPYVKKFDANGKISNEITKEAPFVNLAASNRGNAKKQYIILMNPITGQYAGKLRAHGNNRASRSTRGKNSRLNTRF